MKSRRRELDAADKQLTQEKLQELLQEEMKNVRSQVADAVDETVHYSMEKTERGLERLTNEKMTAVSEYAQTVLEDIHKNHEEVMFLYDMLKRDSDRSIHGSQRSECQGQ